MKISFVRIERIFYFDGEINKRLGANHVTVYKRYQMYSLLR